MLIAGESALALAYIKGRGGLSPRQSVAIILGGMLLVGVPVGVWLTGSWTDALLMVEAVIGGLIIAAFLARKLTIPMQRKALAARGKSAEMPCTIRLTDLGVNVETPDFSTHAGWNGVTDLFATRKYWVFLAGTAAIVVPRRFFPERAAEREFIDTALTFMTQDAAARSPDATRFTSS